MSKMQAWIVVWKLQRRFAPHRKQATASCSFSLLKKVEGIGDSVQESKEYIIRTQSDVAYTYGLGEVVVPGVALFSANPKHYGLTKEELNAALKKLGKVTLR